MANDRTGLGAKDGVIMPMVLKNGEEMYEAFGWNKDNVFFLTKSEYVEIASINEVFNYSNQCLLPCEEELDGFSRNRTDRLFIRLCNRVDLFCTEDTFKSLSCKKDGDRYIARLELSDKTLELELTEMVELLEQRNR